MKTKNIVAQAQALNSQTGTTLEQYLTQAIKQQVNGSVTLDDIQKNVNIERHSLIEALKNNKNVLYVTGRRGHPSRILFGTAIAEYNAAIPAKPSNPNPPTVKRQTAHHSAPMAGEGSLRIHVAGQVINLPISVEVVA